MNVIFNYETAANLNRFFPIFFHGNSNEYNLYNINFIAYALLLSNRDGLFVCCRKTDRNLI